MGSSKRYINFKLVNVNKQKTLNVSDIPEKLLASAQTKRPDLFEGVTDVNKVNRVDVVDTIATSCQQIGRAVAQRLSVNFRVKKSMATLTFRCHKHST